MAIKHQDIKNLVMQELLNESINNEGVTDWLRAQSSKALSGVGKALSGAGEKLKPGDPQIAKKLEKVGDFLQMAQRDKDITQLIMQTDLGKKVFSSQEKSLEEALGQDFVKMMKDKKVTPQEVEAFVAAMNKNKKAKQMLDGLGLDIEVSDQDIEAGKQQGAADTAQTQAQPSQAQPGQQEKPPESQPQTKPDTSTADIQQQTKRVLKPSYTGIKGIKGTPEFKKVSGDLIKIISDAGNISDQNAQKIVDGIWSQLGGTTGKVKQLTLFEEEQFLNITSILTKNGIKGANLIGTIKKIKDWANQNKNIIVNKIGQQPPQAPAVPIKFTPPVEDSTGNPISKSPVKTSSTAYADTAIITAMDMEAAQKKLPPLPPSVYRQAEKQGKDPVTAAREYMDLLLNKQKEERQKEERQKEAEESGGRIGESLKRILMEEIFNAIVGKTK